MHIEGRGRGAENVIVDGADVQPAVEQFDHDGRDFRVEQYQVAHQHGFSLHGRKSDPSSERQCRFDRDAVQRDVQVGAGQSVAVHFTTDRCGLAQRSIYLLPVDVGGSGGQRQQQGCRQC